MQPLLSIKSLSIDFIKDDRATNVLNDVSFDINTNEIVAIVGESGSGKTLTALSVLKLLPQNNVKIKTGEILFYHENEINILSIDEDDLRKIRGNKISMVFQEPMTSLNPSITCGEQVSETIRLHKKITADGAKKQVLDLFNQVELPEPSFIYNRYPHELSGGQKQRVMIAMAMSCKPQLLICDEPTTALDVLVQKSILVLIKKLQHENNMSVLFISHDLNIVSQIADKIIVLYKGKIVEQGNAQNILQYPAHTYTKALLACRPSLYNKNERLAVVSYFMDENKNDKNNENLIQQKAAKNSFEIVIDKERVILEIKNLKVWYKKNRSFFNNAMLYNKAIDDVSFQLKNCETVGLVGASGCGKTTIGRVIMQLIKPTEGEIFFNGENIFALSKQRRRELSKNIQLIFQDPYSSLNPRKKIGEAIEEVMMVHKLHDNKNSRRQAVISLLEKVQFDETIYHRYPHELSGGQRQRVVIARALAVNPLLIICDECTSALDVSIQAQVMNLLNDLKHDFNFTTLFISHDLAAVHYLCDRVIVLKDGKIEETGGEEIYKNPQSVYTKALLEGAMLL